MAVINKWQKQIYITIIWFIKKQFSHFWLLNSLLDWFELRTVCYTKTTDGGALIDTDIDIIDKSQLNTQLNPLIAIEKDNDWPLYY